uniref:ABC-2 type transporter transmembrane domain-containing protein n=1 Tax=Chromera velia CCMP2878 TaxID=1169474 RepID=A0A0G4FNF9_9ALVE|eukprot:Cvel_3552.t1-p1 / transcript=Cvel_3552.t1 / gene=Cvel_3552 / organism=Chromera_velia_CCMP2878 / gene_product=ABC transporter G family member 18, putative / transcript_product=ABC transporter G family member 18, putative / location=Cvel_scaffold145:18581-23152(-) / protein_length=552 / sequence_SO=supercontig / SO=protein_coding / is_pseudo=false
MGTSSLSGISKPTNGWGNLHSSMATAATAAGGALERSETCPPINPSAPTLPIQKSTSMSGGFHRRTYSSLRDEKQLQQLDISQVTGAARNAPWNSQVMIQMARMGKGIVRDPMGFAMRFALEFSIKVVMVGQWYRLNEDFRGAVTIVGGGLENVIGVLVFSLVATSFCALQGMPGMASERKIFVAEQRGNLYAPSSYLVATLLMRLPILMLLQIPNCLLIYYGLGLGDFAQNQLLNFWYYVIIQWTIIWVAEFGSLCVTFFTTNETLAWAMSVYAQAIMLMWSGGIQRVSTMYLVFRYLSTVSFIRWGMDALLWNFIPGRCYEYPGCEGACGFKNPQTGQPNFVDNCAVDGKMLLRSLFNEGTMPDFSPGRLLPPLMNLVIAFILLVTLYFLIMNSIEKSKPAKKAQQKGASASSSEDPDNNRHDEIGRIVGLPSFAPQATMGSQGSDGRPARVASWTAATFSRNMTMQADVPLNRQGSAGGSGGGSSGGARRRKASNIGGTVPSNLRLDRKMSKESEDAQTPSPGIHDWNQVVRSPGLRVEPQGPTGDQRV